MRTLLLSILALGTLLGGTRVAHAGFFDRCLVPRDQTNQTIDVVQNTVVKNVKVTLQANRTQESCQIIVADGVTLTLMNVVVDAAKGKRLIFEGGSTSSLLIN